MGPTKLPETTPAEPADTRELPLTVKLATSKPKTQMGDGGGMLPLVVRLARKR